MGQELLLILGPIKKWVYTESIFLPNKDYKGIEVVKIMTSENDPANLRPYEAFYMRKCKPTSTCTFIN